MLRLRTSPWLSQFFTAPPDSQASWHRKPLSVIALYIFLALLAYWEIRVPSPGEAVAALGVAAAAMSIRGEMQGKEKVAWMLLLFAFLSLELTSIDTERTANEEMQAMTRRQEAEHFSEIGDGIAKGVVKSQAQYTSTMLSLGENLKMVTGGDSVCYLAFMRTSDPNKFAISAIQRGRYPLRNVEARMVNLRAFNAIAAKGNLSEELLHTAGSNFKIDDLPISGGLQIGTQELLASENSRDFNVFFDGLNGFWNQEIRLRRVNGKWLQATKVSRAVLTPKHGPEEKFLFQRVDKDFPLVNGKVDWTEKP